ncbi:MAG: hypothetical protein ACFFCJ_11685 [Promethearchaeota archaeon]
MQPDDYFILTPNYVDNLHQLIGSESNYSTIGNIKTVQAPDGKDLTPKEWWAIMDLYSIDQYQDFSMGALICKRSDNDWKVLGFHLPNIIQFPFINKNFVLYYVQVFTHRPDKFIDFHVVSPIG